MAAAGDDFEDIKRFRADLDRVRAHFAELRKKVGPGWGPFRFDIRDQKRLGKINSLEKECLSKAGSPNADVDGILAWADKEIEKE